MRGHSQGSERQKEKTPSKCNRTLLSRGIKSRRDAVVGTSESPTNPQEVASESFDSFRYDSAHPCRLEPFIPDTLGRD